MIGFIIFLILTYILGALAALVVDLSESDSSKVVVSDVLAWPVRLFMYIKEHSQWKS